jgi:protocatechuate 3,4-dioxygenase beta subunit
VDEKLNRTDIRSDPTDGAVKDGLPLGQAFLVPRAASQGCVPLPGATVGGWHCDAAGAYSDVLDPGFSTKGEKFLRGYQVADSDGIARFTTIYPGWHQGRTVRVHFKIRGPAGSGANYEFTWQLFFDDELTDPVYGRQPYAAKGQRAQRDGGDRISVQSGNLITLSVDENADGMSSMFSIGLQIQPESQVTIR